MRVLFINENIGGHATVHHHLAAALTDRPDVHARWLHVPPPGWLRRVAGAGLPGLARLDLDLQPLRAQLAVSAWVRSRLARLAPEVDVVHGYTQNALLLSADLLARIPSVVTTDSTNTLNAFRLPYRTPTSWTARTLPVARVAERRVLAAASMVVANSEFVATSLREDYGIVPSRLRVLPFGVPMPPPPVPARPPRPGRLPRLVFVGRQLERKGGLQLVRLHQEQLADRCELMLITEEEVLAGRNLVVRGDVRPGDGQVFTELAAADVFVFPSAIDQAPNCVLEAMACGLPVVACPTGAVPEMVQPEVNGLLVQPGDDEGLLAALRRLVDDPELRLRMGAASRARAEQRYDMSASAAALVEILQQAWTQHGGGRRRIPVARATSRD